MSKKAKSNQKAQPKSVKRVERAGVQVVLRVPEETKALLARQAKDLGISMNAAACERLATGRWPAKAKKEDHS